METIQRLAAFLLVIFTGFCIFIWMLWFNPNFDGLVSMPIVAEDFPGNNPMYSPLLFAFGSLFVAYLIYPAPDRDD